MRGNVINVFDLLLAVRELAQLLKCYGQSEIEVQGNTMNDIDNSITY